MSRSRVRPGRESVWDYPRPPRLERTQRRIKVVFGWITPDVFGPFKGGPGTRGW